MTALFNNAFRHSFIQLSSPAKLRLLVLLVLFFALIGSFVAMLLAIPIYHIDLAYIFRTFENPDTENIRIIKFFQMSQTVYFFIIPALLASWLFSENILIFLKVSRKPSVITLFLILFTLVTAVPMLNMITEMNLRLDLPMWLDGIEKKMMVMEERAARLTELFLTSNSIRDLLVNFLMIAILPAIGEELLFRGVIQRLFQEWIRNAHMAIMITAFLFSFIHFQFYGFLPRFLLGLYFGYLMIWSGTLWVPIAGHLINNGMAVIYYHFTSKPMGESMLDTVGTGEGTNYLVYLSAFLTSLLVGMVYLHERRHRTLQR